MENKNLYNAWISHSMASVHVVVAVVSAFLYEISRVGDYPRFRDAGILIFIIGIIHFLLHTNLNRQYHFLYDNRNIKSLPIKMIMKLNLRYVIQYLICSAGVIAVAAELRAGHLLQKIADLLSTGFTWLFKLFFQHGEIDTGEVDPAYRFAFLNRAEGREALDTGLGDFLLSVIQGILVVTGLLFMVSLIGLTLYQMLRKALKASKAIMANAEVCESEDINLGLLKEKNTHLSVWSRNPNIRIRRRYKSEINRLRRTMQKIPENMTPSEIEQMVGAPDNDAYRELHSCYEKARYSNKKCSSEDYEKIRRLQFKR